jgi:vacuolar-type H+-ATPase subunit C/Vma6
METCRMHLANTYRRIRSFFAEDGARLIAILLARWDLFNVKAIVRGQVARARPQEILDALVPAGTLDEGALRTLARQADPLATLDLLRMWNLNYGQAARAALGRFEATRDWSAVEAAFDAAFYARLLAALKGGARNDELVRDLLAREIDVANLLTALRRDLPVSWLTSLVSAARDDDVFMALRRSKFGAALAGADTLDVGALQDILDRDLARSGVGFFARDPLTIATAIGFISAKRVEVSNVRLIAQGVALGMEQAEIEKALIVV